MTLKHAKTSVKTDGGDATLVQPSDWNADHVIDSGGVDMVVGASVPAAPAAGNVRLFGRDVGGRMMPAFIGPSGMSTPIQPHMARNKLAVMLPNGAGGGVTLLGMVAMSGTQTARNVGTVNLMQSMRRVGYVGNAAANAWVSARHNNGQWFIGNQQNMGGFHFVCRFGISTAADVPDAKYFFGLYAGAVSTVDPSTCTNIIGIGKDTADTTFSMVCNDGSGLATKVALGANFPATTQSEDAYEVSFFAAPNSASIDWRVTRLNTGDVAAGTFSTNTPAANTLMQPNFMSTSGAAATAVAFDIVSLYIETDY